MFKRLLLVTATIVIALSAAAQEAQKSTKAWIVIHGGAGTITRDTMTPVMERSYRADLEQALRLGWGVLNSGGSSLDAVERVVRFLEDQPNFNAGKGAVFTHDGRNELDAAIMDGKTKAAGSVAGVQLIKNPISAARAVMEKSEHVMLVGRGAETFASDQGLELVDPSYFWTARRWQALQNELKKEKGEKPRADAGIDEDPKKYGTVGCVAVDKNGNLAAGTSTGGMTNKKYGRVGDAPIIGAGTYADNNSCAVSATGHGEFFIRWTVARDIAALVEYKGMTVQQAGDEVIHKKLEPVKGEGGVIILDKNGNYAMPFNSEGMYRGWIGADAVPHVDIYK
jgi:beta-aspartyl-peptidase (threonine type)